MNAAVGSDLDACLRTAAGGKPPRAGDAGAAAVLAPLLPTNRLGGAPQRLLDADRRELLARGAAVAVFPSVAQSQLERIHVEFASDVVDVQFFRERRLRAARSSHGAGCLFVRV